MDRDEYMRLVKTIYQGDAKKAAKLYSDVLHEVPEIIERNERKRSEDVMREGLHRRQWIRDYIEQKNFEPISPHDPPELQEAKAEALALAHALEDLYHEMED